MFEHRLEETPNHFLCPITQGIMEDPVVTADGFSYERIAIERWFERNRHLSRVPSPLTNLPLANRSLVPNMSLKQAIDAWKTEIERRQLLAEEEERRIAARREHLEEALRRVAEENAVLHRELDERLRREEAEKERRQREQIEGLERNPRRLRVIDEDDNTLLHLAAQAGDLLIVKYLVEKGLDVRARNMMGASVLYMACAAGHDSVVEYLLRETAAKEDKEEPVYGGARPAHIAAENGHTLVLEALNAAQTNLTLEDEDKRTPLHYACRYGQIQAAEYLIGAGLEVKKQDRKGHTPFHLACRENREEIARLLLQADRDLLHIADREGKYAQDMTRLPIASMVLRLRQQQAPPEPSAPPAPRG